MYCVLKPSLSFSHPLTRRAACTLATGSVDDNTGHYWYDTEGLVQASVSGRIVALPCYYVPVGLRITDSASTVKVSSSS